MPNTKKKSKSKVVKKEVIKKKDNIIQKKAPTTKNNYKNLEINSTFDIYKKLFDKCYKQERFDTYDNWITVGMALKNIYNDLAFPLFDYYSSKGNNYEGTDITKYKYDSFRYQYEKGYTLSVIHRFAKEDNPDEYKNIMDLHGMELEESDVALKIKDLAGDRFIYQKNGDGYTLFCYNGKYWESDKDAIKLKRFISTELYSYYKSILVTDFWKHPSFSKYRSKLEKLKSTSLKENLVKTYKEYGVNNSVRFDDKYWLFGFSNCVYDLKIGEFRDYQKDDYISLTTNYDWREPTEEELNTVNDLINKIMPIEEERKLYLSILATTLEGRCLEKFIIFNGAGGNGKGAIDDILLIALGDDYALGGNNAIFFERSKTGSNPEKANINKKRLLLVREPSEKQKFENSVVKELTGGGVFSARTHQEKDTKKHLYCTVIVECNKKPLFAEEPTEVVFTLSLDLLFRASFKEDESLWDDSKYIFKANPYIKTSEFQHKHKYALLKILMDTYKEHQINNYVLTIPESVRKRTNEYIALSCRIIPWFKDKYTQTNKKSDYVKIKSIFNNFEISKYYNNLSRRDKQKYNYAYFLDFFSSNDVFRKQYVRKSKNMSNFLIGYKEVEMDSESDSESYSNNIDDI